MIRKHEEKDLEEILNVWYEAQALAHPFLHKDFVEKVKKDMREIYIPNSETWVYEGSGSVIGFIGMQGNEIGGLFVLPDYQSKGIGSKLVQFICDYHDELEVEVFKENNIGLAFYNKYGFKVVDDKMDEGSGFEVVRMRLNY